MIRAVAERTILHADMDAFYAAVEQRDDPTLRGRPVIVGGLGRRGVVSTASYEARRFGVHSAMPMARARLLCPDAVVLRPRMEHYAAVSSRIRGVFDRYTPIIEPLSLDEAFLDVTDGRALFGDGRAVAERIRAEVRAATALTVSVGVASSKFVAKVASDLDKPDGLVVVAPGEEVGFLAPLPVKRLWGAGPVTQRRLASLGLRTIGDVQACDPDALVRVLGAVHGTHFFELAHGRDDRPVEAEREARSISHETTFERDVRDGDELHRVLLGLAESVGRRLRNHRLRGRVVKLKLRFPPFRTITRQRTLAAATDDDLVVHRAARELLDEARAPGAPVRLIGIGVSDLVGADEPRQGMLFGPGGAPAAGRSSRLLEAMDRIRERFGDDAIRHGGT